ncbi:hypothetical protein ACWIGI_18315 [Nocardia sp. NPDC055321]
MAEENGVDADVSVVPGTVRAAGALASVQGALGVIVALVLVLRAATGADQHVVNGYATAAWLFVLAGAVLAAGLGLLRGKRWGRSIAVIAQLLLLPPAWYMLTSHQPGYGIPLGISAIVGLGLLMAPASSRWMAAGYDIED